MRRVKEATAKLSSSERSNSILGRKYWVVTYPTKDSVKIDILFSATIKDMVLQFKGGLDYNEIVGMFEDQKIATDVADRLLKMNESAPDRNYRVNEAKEPKVMKVIKDLADAYGDSNEAQGKMVQLLRGLAFSDDPKANQFMKALDKWTTTQSNKMSKE